MAFSHNGDYLASTMFETEDLQQTTRGTLYKQHTRLYELSWCNALSVGYWQLGPHSALVDPKGAERNLQSVCAQWS